MKERYVVFTDGSARGNPGPGGFATVVIDVVKNTVAEFGGHEEVTTNNRMELMAAITAAQALPSHVVDDIVFYTDSSYVANGITAWVFGWQKNGWQTSTGGAVENQDLWQQLVVAVRGKKISWQRIDGHAGVPGNERCDEIATSYADGVLPRLFSGALTDYHIKDILNVSRGVTLLKKKAGARNAPAFSYISMVSGKIMTHKTWKECEARVKGVPGARFKKSQSASDEAEIIKSFRGV